MARLRPIPHEDKLAFKEVLDRYLLQGFKVIETLPETSRVSAAMLVRKGEGRNQLAFDYRTLNARVHAVWPLPLVGCLDCLVMAKCLSALNINTAYYSIMVAEESRSYLTFLSHHGVYRWRVYLADIRILARSSAHIGYR